MHLPKHHYGRYFFVLFLALFLWQCSSRQKGISDIAAVAEKKIAGTDSLIALNIKTVTDTITVKLSDLASDLEIVQLEDHENAYTSMSNTVVSPSYIGIAGNMQIPFKLFDRKTGKFITNVGNVGRGPGEYFTIYSAQIDEPGGRIYLLPWMQQCIQVYDLEGKPVTTIPTPYKMPKAVMQVDPGTQTITIGVLPFEGVKSALWQQDFNGNILYEVPAAHLAVTPDYSNEVLSGNNTPAFDYSIITWGGRPDTLYHFVSEKKAWQAAFTIDFNFTPGNARQQEYQAAPQDNVPIHSYLELPDRYIADISFPKQTSENSWSTSKPVWVMVDKATLKACYFNLKNDFMGNIPAWPSFSRGFYLSNSEPQLLIEALEKALKETSPDAATQEKIQSLLERINPEGNNVILIGKLK